VDARVALFLFRPAPFLFPYYITATGTNRCRTNKGSVEQRRVKMTHAGTDRAYIPFDFSKLAIPLLVAWLLAQAQVRVLSSRSLEECLVLVVEIGRRARAQVELRGNGGPVASVPCHRIDSRASGWIGELSSRGSARHVPDSPTRT
jgi:hypothetical protein